MRFAVESWAPEYGSGLDAERLETPPAQVNAGVELPEGSWAPLSVPEGVRPASTVRLVDGVRRIDARVWITGPDGLTRPGIAASYAAGVVCCDGAARIETCEVRRSLFSAAPDLAPIVTRHGAYAAHITAGESTDELSLELQRQMGVLEAAVVGQAGEADLLIVDGPLGKTPQLPAAVGYVKTHQRAYLPPELSAVVTALRPGQRTPLFVTATSWSRYSWYLRLAGGSGHPWAGVVRCEVSGDMATANARRLADLASATIPRFASSAHKDPRAPQNLYPIAELERNLRRLLGDPHLLYRALRAAASTAPPP